VPDAGKKLNAMLTCARSLPEALLRIRVDENTDFTCDRIWPDEDVSITSFSIKASSGQGAEPTSSVIEDGQTVQVQGISAGSRYEVQVEYDVPQELSNAVGTPVFRLELVRPPSQASTSKNTKGGDQNAD
jgi:hypothetical protein